MRLTALLGLAFAVGGTSVASAADVSGFKIAIGQGTTTFKKKNVRDDEVQGAGLAVLPDEPRRRLVQGLAYPRSSGASRRSSTSRSASGGS